MFNGIKLKILESVWGFWIYHFVEILPLAYYFSQLAEQSRFQSCCQRAFRSALMLVARCGGVEEAALEKRYVEDCRLGVFADRFDQPSEEDLMESECVEEPKGDAEETLNVLKSLKEESDVITDGIKEPTVPSGLAGLPDLQVLQELLNKPKVLKPCHSETNEPEHVDLNHLPSSLMEALTTTKGDLWNSLFRLAVRLRSDKGGADTSFLKNARNARGASKKLNWHQCLDCMGGCWFMGGLWAANPLELLGLVWDCLGNFDVLCLVLNGFAL